MSHEGATLSWRRVDEGPTAGLIEVWLHREPLNEIGEETLAELEALVAAVEAEAAAGRARALLLASRLPRGFCAGADLRALAAGIAERGHEAAVAEARAFVARINRALSVLDAAPLPTVAAVHGPVFGGGLELALCCDLVVADRTARFAFPELRLGLVPGFGGLARLERDLGGARARDLLLTGRSLGAAAAERAGLAGQVVGPGRHVDVARRAALQAARLDREALRAVKHRTKPVDPARLEADQELFCRLLARPEAARALARFVERADPLPYLPEEPTP